MEEWFIWRIFPPPEIQTNQTLIKAHGKSTLTINWLLKEKNWQSFIVDFFFFFEKYRKSFHRMRKSFLGFPCELFLDCRVDELLGIFDWNLLVFLDFFFMNGFSLNFDQDFPQFFFFFLINLARNSYLKSSHFYDPGASEFQPRNILLHSKVGSKFKGFIWQLFLDFYRHYCQEELV
jgi:hypothetical protein